MGSTKCYKCSSGWKHDPSKKVTTTGVCYKSAYTDYKSASKIKSISLSCPSGQFYDPIHKGSCWQCPRDYNRTAYPVTDNKACSKAIPANLSKANFIKKAQVTSLGCDVKGKEAFFDLRNGGECWTCSKAYPVRTAYYAVDS